jgi:hypothetical protein
MKKYMIGLTWVLFALSALTDLGNVIFVILLAVGWILVAWYQRLLSGKERT